MEFKRKSFASNPAPVLAGVIRERTPREAIATIKNYALHGANGADLHLSCLDDEYKNVESIGTIIKQAPLPILGLNYNEGLDWKINDTSEEERVALLMMAIDAGAAGIDIQGYTFDKPSKAAFREEFSHLDYSFIKPRPHEVVVDPKIIEKQCDLIERVHFKGAEVLLSNHLHIVADTQMLVDLCLFLEERKPDIIKIVTNCETDEDMLESFKSMLTIKKEIKTPVTLFCNGPASPLTRIINPMLGGYMVFTSDGFNARSNFTQMDLQTIKQVLDGVEKLTK
jgi:hypothetical protein